MARDIQRPAAAENQMCMPNRLAAGPTARRGFTLVEMLVVITIIGILASLGTVAVFKALEAAKRARIKVEITNLNNAIESYKLKHGDYPPSFYNGNAPLAAFSLSLMKSHLGHCFPRCNPDFELSAFNNALGTNARNGLTPAQMLVFWLTSISKDPAHPISAPTTDREALFDFDKTRLVSIVPGQVGGWSVSGTGANAILTYIPQVYIDQSGKNSPFVYFEARGYFGHATQAPNSPLIIPNCYPYLWEPWDNNKNGKIDPGTSGPPQQDVQVDGSGNWIPTSFQKICANPKSFQIISAGLDGIFGAPPGPINTASAKFNGSNLSLYYKSFPSGLGYDTTGADDDNLTNFSEGQLGDAKP
jgi:prepilin-type N-terminal cleavage/methylation domain-containing protein